MPRVKGTIDTYIPTDIKDIPGFEGVYAVTPDGRVWSYPKKHWRRGRGIWLKQYDKRGYLNVALCRWHPRKQKAIKRYYRVHRLVAMAYIRTNNFKRQVNHKDGNKQNNHYNNLEWNTPIDNTHHAIRTGLRKSTGQDNGNAKLTLEQVTEIRRMYQAKEHKVYEIAALYGVHRSHISLIGNNKAWKQKELQHA